MGVHAAEYLGQRTDIDNPVIIPNTNVQATCPFSSGNICKKVKSHYHPICSVRKVDGTLWIVCSERLCTTKKDYPLCEHQQKILYNIAQYIYGPDVDFNDVCVKREEPLSVLAAGTDYHADYIISLKSGRSDTSGPDKLILEMQGGGETTNTGKLTAIVNRWVELTNRTNADLRAESQASTLETNAWRRQQEQFIVKGNIAMKTWKGYGIAFCMGTLLFDYLMEKLKDANLPDLKNYNWTLAVIGIKEDTSQPVEAGAIPLCVDDSRILYTNYQTFVQALINQGIPSLDAFKGMFTCLNNEPVSVP